MPDLPRPAGEKQQGASFVTHESMGRSLGSQKKVLGRVIGVEKRLGNAEKKITILKNILKMRQQSENIGGVIKGIEESVDAIAETTDLNPQCLTYHSSFSAKFSTPTKTFFTSHWNKYVTYN